MLQRAFTKDTIRQIMVSTDHFSGKAFAVTIRLLIVLSLVTFSVDTLPDIGHRAKEILHVIEVVTVGIFSLEYALRIAVSENRMRFICSFYGFVDLAAILPFYISSGLDLRAVRIFRLLRLVRILKLFKYNQAIMRFQRAFVIAKEELILFGFIEAIVLYLSAVGIYYCENQAQPEQFKSVFHSLWWAVTTLTTVGYGDMFPVTTGGKIFTFFVLMIGLGIVSVPTGLITSALSQTRSEDAM